MRTILHITFSIKLFALNKHLKSHCGGAKQFTARSIPLVCRQILLPNAVLTPEQIGVQSSSSHKAYYCRRVKAGPRHMENILRCSNSMHHMKDKWILALSRADFYVVPNHPLTDPGSSALPHLHRAQTGTAFSVRLFYWEIYSLQRHLHESYLLLWILVFYSKQMFLWRLKIIMMHVPSDNQSVMHWWTVWEQTTMRFRSSFDAQSWNSTIMFYHHQQIDTKHI